MADEPRERRKRGVPLRELDRSKSWVIAYTGRRWEVVGPADDLGRAVVAPVGALGAGDAVASTGDLRGTTPPRGDDSPEGT